MASPPPESTGHVFLSYASSDRERALGLADLLEAQGIRVWIDRSSIVGGSSWTAEIVRGIQGCAALIALCSPASVSSANVQRELNLAVEHDRPLIPLLLAPTDFPAEVQYALAGRQRIELLDRPEQEWLPQLLQGLRRLRVAPEPKAVATHDQGIAELNGDAPYTNLPTALTRFLGREKELSELAELLKSNRLVTLTGPGGTGKTRLAIAAAGQVLSAFPDGVWFVDLSGVADPAGVIPAIAQLLEVRDGEGRSLAVSLAAYLRRKSLLLVLDNFEQVVAAAMALYDLLVESAGLSLLVTSRVLLRVESEREYAVPPLPLPDAGDAVPEQLRANPAVQLFVERVQMLRPGFGLSSENAAAVAAICRRLDGLPLAIELAAARAKLLPPAQLLVRLEQRLAFLTGGERNRPQRQQTLRATITWSWDLLTESERVLFRRLAVFAGGWSLEAAETVCNPDGGLDVLEALSSLVDQSLVRQQDEPSGAPRFVLLATLQEFAHEQLALAGEGDGLRHGHAAYYCSLAEAAHTAFWRRGRYAVLETLFRERDNLLAALSWLLAANDGETGLRLAAALQMYWYLKEPGEGLRWTETFLRQATGDVPLEARGGGHLAAFSAATAYGEESEAFSHAEQATALLRGTAAQADLAQALCYAALAWFDSDAPRARLALEEARNVAAATGAEHLVGWVACATAIALLIAQSPAEGRRYAEEALRIGRRLEAEWLTAITLHTLGQLAQACNDLPAARTYLEQALPLREWLQSRWDIAITLTVLASCEAESGEPGALRTWQASLTKYVDIGNRTGMVVSLLGVAAVCASGGEAAMAVRLLGAVDAKVEEVLASAYRIWAEPVHEQALALAHGALSAAAFAGAWEQGQMLSLDEATDLALAAQATSTRDDRGEARPRLNRRTNAVTA